MATYSGRIFTEGDKVYFRKYWQNKYSSAAAGVYSNQYDFYATVNGLNTASSSVTHPIQFTSLHNTSGTITGGGGYLTPSEVTKGYQVKVTYSHNGGSGTASQTGYVGKSLTGTSSRTGYTFKGWYTSTSSSTKVTTIPTDAKTYYAQWTAKTYTVTFNANGGSSTTTVSEQYNSNYSLPSNPTRTGYTFAGWYTATSGGTQVTSSTKVTTASNHSVYARWTANPYSVAFNGNGASGSMSNQSFVYGTAQTLTTNTFDRGIAYLFTGWNTQSDGSGTSYADNESVINLTSTKNGTVTLYAQWELQYLAPSITNISAIRSDSNGNPQDDGQYLHLTFDWAVDTIVYPQNYATLIQIKTKASNESNWSNPYSETPVVGTSSDSFSYTSPSGSFYTDLTYNIKIEVSDWYGSNGLNPPISAPQATGETFLSSAYFILDFANAGHNIGIGTVASNPNPHVDELSIGMDTSINGFLTSKIPAGFIKMFAGAVVPSGWLLCDGSDVSSNDYPLLYATIGTAYGSGNGSTTDFNLPDLRGRFPLGAGSGTATDATPHSLGDDGGTETHKLTAAQLPNITGSFYVRGWGTSNGAMIYTPSGVFSTSVSSNKNSTTTTTSSSDSARQVTMSFGSNGAHPNMPPYLGINFIISTGEPSGWTDSGGGLPLVRGVVCNGQSVVNNSIATFGTDFIVAGVTSAQSFSDANSHTITIDKIIDSFGTRLTLDTTNNTIVVGNGVRYVEVYFQLYFSTVGTDAGKQILITKNGSIIARGQLRPYKDYNIINVSKIISAQENDVLKVSAIANGATTSISTYDTYFMVKTIV